MGDLGGLPVLRCLGGRQLVVGARRVLDVPAARHGRFIWLSGGCASVVGDGPRSRWACRLEPGEVLLLCPGERARIRSACDQSAELHLLEFEAEGDGLERYASRMGPPVPVRLPGAAHVLEGAGAGLSGAAADWGEAGPADVIAFLRAQAHLHELMAAYLSGVRTRAASGPLLAYADQVRRQMAAHCDQEYDIETIARASGVSPHRFYQAFRELTGLTPHKYLSAVRLRRSLRLLAGEFRSVAEVAHAVGYADELYFSRVFKREMGLSPSAFAQLARSGPPVPAPAGDLAIFGLSAASGGAAPEHAESGAPGEPRFQGWRERVQRLGERLGLEGVAGHWLALMDQRLCHLRALVRRRFREAPCLVVGVGEDGYRVFGARHPGLGELLYVAAGFMPWDGVADLSETRLGTLDEVAGLGCPAALFLQGREGPEGGIEAAWLERVGERPGAGCVVVRWEGGDDAATYEHLVEQLILHLLEINILYNTV